MTTVLPSTFAYLGLPGGMEWILTLFIGLVLLAVVAGLVAWFIVWAVLRSRQGSPAQPPRHTDGQ